MASPTKTVMRSPLKETDANLKQPPNLTSNLNALNTKKRLLEPHRLQDETEQQTLALKKRPKIERARSIEGAVLVSKTAALKNIEPKVTPKELLEWQNNWKKIMKRDSKIYFDITDEIDTTKNQKRILDKKQELLKRGFISLGAQIALFFDNSVTIVITRRPTDKLHLQNENDILKRAKKNYMKVWGYEKATRFLTNLDVDLNELAKNKNPTVSSPSLSNLLQNEKLYGPNDRDPRTKRDDMHYFKYPHIYMYDLWQIWSPIIILEWKPQELSNKMNLPYPTLKMGTLGRCPFVGDRSCDESSYRRVMKRYGRDKINKRYALKLRQLYQYRAEPYLIQEDELIYIPHTSNDSKESYDKWQETKKQLTYGTDENSTNNEPKITTIEENVNESHVDSSTTQASKNPTVPLQNNVPAVVNGSLSHETSIVNSNEKSTKPDNSANKYMYKEPLTPQLKRPVLASFTRQETEDFFPDDLCSSKRQSRLPYEIKASGVHQSNDVATSFGNGLGPTKASVMSKNIKTLNRLVVDRKLGTSKIRKTNSVPSLTHAVSASSNHENIAKASAHLNMEIVTNSETKDNEKIALEHDVATDLRARDLNINVTSLLHSTKESSKLTVAPIKKPVVKNSGYCENCRVKYDSLDQHILSEKHVSFAENSLNFEAIDSLVEKLKFQF